MTFRTLLAAAAVIILLGVNGYLLFLENRPTGEGSDANLIAPSEVQVRHRVANEDPLFDLLYVSGNREQNFQAFGLDEALTVQAIKRTRQYEDNYIDRIKALVEESPDPVELADALCGQTRQVRPRYGAVRFLIEEKSGRRQAIDIKRTSSLERQDWSLLSSIEAVYAEVELADERKDDATRMGLAAILANKESDLLDRHKPWGRGLTGNWSWDKVVEGNPGVEETIIEYFALLHLTVEVANGEDGICGD